MSGYTFEPTDEQLAVINHDGSAFVTACPGAGKTRVMVERSRQLLRSIPHGRGLAFLSFTQSAIFELETRLRERCLLPTPNFPSFIGTFDSFIWQFLVAPFGVQRCEVRPRLIPDIEQREVEPFRGAHKLPLSCFCPQTGTIDEDAAKRRGFDVSKKSVTQIQQYMTAAMQIRSRLQERGHLGFDAVRAAAVDRIKDPLFSGRISEALKTRFVEVIVDEAQDCNPDDLMVISWLRDSGLPVKVICDPHQSIYEFRGGVTNHLFGFADTFLSDQRKVFTGNFRSSPSICKAIVQFRPPSSRGSPDVALGPLKDEARPIQILSYQGSSVPPSIGRVFCTLLEEAGIDVSASPIVAATKQSSSAAAGQPLPSGSNHRSIRLAEAVTRFHFAVGFNDMRDAIDGVHQILLELEGHLDSQSYHQFLTENEIEHSSWRPKIISILRALRFDSTKHTDARAWLTAARDLLSNELGGSTGQSLSQSLKWNKGLEGVLASVPALAPIPRTIHSVKGMEFPAVCVVTTKTLKRILDFLETGEPVEAAEEARKLYVAASRAKRLLVIAAPKSQTERLRTHLSIQGAVITTTEI